MPLAKLIPSFFAFILTLAVSLHAMGLREAKESHNLTVAHAINEVAKGMASQIQIALKEKDFAAAEAINGSLSDFLSSDDKPASLINVPEIANRYAAKRKESAQVVLQLYRDELSSTRLASDPLQSEMDEFIKKETHAQRLAKSGEKDPKMAPASATGLAQSSPESLPRKTQKNPTESPIPATRKPSTKPIGSRSDQDDPSILTPERIQQMDDRIAGIQDEYLSKFDGATTDIQRQKVASAHRDAAIEECFGAATSMHIEIDCELIKGTKFRIHVPVTVLDGSNPDPILQRLVNRFRFSQEIGFEKSYLLIGDLPVKASINKKTKAGSGRHPLMNLSVSLYAVWLLASIESDEIQGLPEYIPPETPELGGSKRR